MQLFRYFGLDTGGAGLVGSWDNKSLPKCFKIANPEELEYRQPMQFLDKITIKL